MAEYLDKVSTIITALDTVNEIISEKDLIMCVVRGLPSAYSSIKQAVRISPTPVDLATLSSWLKSKEINVDLESKLLLRETAVIEPVSVLTASQNYRGRRGGGRQRSRSGYNRNSGGRGRGGRQGSRPPYDGQQHGSNNSLHSFGSGGQSSSSGGQGTYEWDRPTCQIYQKTGHTVVRCWFRYEESRNSDNRANYAYQVGPSSEWLLDTGANMHFKKTTPKLLSSWMQ
ncbi:uncharacterized protein [Solanum lycopersicum]|uniref:uncharacterized protein n=1 Tax=Solanum lycopersicum TaxID=4081 RepID=UPI00374983AC